MLYAKNKKIPLVAVIMLTIFTFQLTMPAPTKASDHIDGPQLANDHASDINDMYFFLDPNDNSRVVMVMTVNPFMISSEIIGQAIFDHNLRYRFEIENTATRDRIGSLMSDSRADSVVKRDRRLRSLHFRTDKDSTRR